MAFAHSGGHGEDRWTAKTPGDLKDGQRPSLALVGPTKASGQRRPTGQSLRRHPGPSKGRQVKVLQGDNGMLSGGTQRCFGLRRSRVETKAKTRDDQ